MGIGGSVVQIQYDDAHYNGKGNETHGEEKVFSC